MMRNYLMGEMYVSLVMETQKAWLDYYAINACNNIALGPHRFMEIKTIF